MQIAVSSILSVNTKDNQVKKDDTSFFQFKIAKCHSFNVNNLFVIKEHRKNA